jgi:DeoR/GlpR family transcriptional regulator of sugar metabolism
MKVNEKKFLEERHRKILEILRERARVTVDDLSGLFKTSGATIRSDLNLLAGKGMLLRTHGGAMVRQDSDTELPVQARKRTQGDIKKRIGKAAASLVQDGEVIFIDSSSTAFSMIPFLSDRKELTVVTNSIDAAYELSMSTQAGIIIPGGTIRRETLSVVGTSIGSCIMDSIIGKTFAGAWGFTIEDGLTDVNPGEIEMKKSAIEKTRSLIAVVDSTKWGRVSRGRFAATEQISVIITDRKAPAKIVSALKKMGITVILVPQT